ncbi:hypothetical protein HPB52_024482 [Rhipicephalus sanguineus]|uniref:Uncharacterized protein n=1 Tax=Rhipicephalus sanguineus TaxID=34632 RepID=A0A9D4YS16_RHISA|nr:hypothetical protein HPB52_024482 [Rhipicephalus sanguineus]
MDSGQCLERQQRHHATHAGRTEDGVPSAHNDVGEDAGCLNVSGKGIDDYCVPRSPYAPIFDVASPSIAGFPGILFSSRLRLRVMGGPGGLRDAAYWPELDECTRLEYRGTSAPRDCKNSLLQLKQTRLQKSSKQAGRNVDVRGTNEMTAAEPHVGHSDDKSDSELYARNSESCGNAQVDPTAVEHDLWEDRHGVHSGPVVTVYGTVSIMRSPTAPITVDRVQRVDIVEEGQRRLPRRPQNLAPPLRPRTLYGKARS